MVFDVLILFSGFSHWSGVTQQPFGGGSIASSRSSLTFDADNLPQRMRDLNEIALCRHDGVDILIGERKFLQTCLPLGDEAQSIGSATSTNDKAERFAQTTATRRDSSCGARGSFPAFASMLPARLELNADRQAPVRAA